MLAGSLPQTPLGELTALPHTSQLVSRGHFVAGGVWRGGEGRTRVRGGRGKGGIGKGGKRGKLEGIAPWLLGGQTPLTNRTAP